MSEHHPVLLHETLTALALRPRGRYVDATYGRGGHARGILERLDRHGKLLVMDRDPDAIAAAHSDIGADSRVTIVQEAFSKIGATADRLGWGGQTDGVLLDIGVSSPQLDEARRGFSFQADGPLDMRMDPGSGQSAAAWLARADVREIGQALRRYGEERFYKRIARAIVAAREQDPIERTTQLAAIVADAVPLREPGRHPATRVFQALRIVVNDELRELEQALEQTVALLAGGGRLCVISFHSLEDRIVKRFMRRHSLVDSMWRGLPDIPAHAQPVFKRPETAVRANAEEIRSNPRSRSAVLRVAERVR